MMSTQITAWQPTAEAMSKTTHAVTELGRGNLEALTRSTQAYVTGMQDLNRLYVTAVQGLMQQAVESTKAFAAAKTPQDVLAVQAELTRASIGRILSEGTKLQQAAQKMAEQISAPLTQRAAAAVEQRKLAQAA
ncbi:phasin family protein [Roseomonas sp. E05]|uniref:phasin family protein n=1 Tax=Roseomonas sp. E05 TaxID=3046310 RepID=UPI0024BB585E|nr:phasin family protein [Roseomonas sp. E05]MDJ0391196.1 phasin family protein [Roseomonas sp. E05]